MLLLLFPLNFEALVYLIILHSLLQLSDWEVSAQAYTISYDLPSFAEFIFITNWHKTKFYTRPLYAAPVMRIHVLMNWTWHY
jgi:hypothetical protein